MPAKMLNMSMLLLFRTISIFSSVAKFKSALSTIRGFLSSFQFWYTRHNPITVSSFILIPVLVLIPNLSYTQWDSSEYSKTATVTIAATPLSLSGAVANFPVLVRVTSSQTDFFGSFTQDDGDDVRFTDSNGDSIAYELERWDDALDVAEFWVLIPSVGTGNTTFNMYWGYGTVGVGASQPGKVFQTSNSFDAVLHLEDTGPFSDATDNGYDGTDNVDATGKTGVVGRGQDLDGTNDNIDLGTSPGSGNDLTIGLWVRPDDLNVDRIFDKQSGTGKVGYSILKRGSGDNYKIMFRVGSEADYGGWPDDCYYDNGYSADTWSHFTFTFKYNGSNGGTCRIYIDGAEVVNAANTDSRVVSNTADNLIFGDWSGEDLDGELDEIQISNVERSADWIELTYETQKTSPIVSIGATSANNPTRTWDGGGTNDNWGNDDNWDHNDDIQDGDHLVFAGSTKPNNDHNRGIDATYSSITFASGAAAFTLRSDAGDNIILNGPITSNSTNDQTINIDITLNATQTMNTASGDIFLGGVLSGTGGLTKTGSNEITLSGDNTYTGITTISAGDLGIGGGGTTGSISNSSDIVNNSGLWFWRSDAYAYSGDISGTGDLTHYGPGTLTLSGSSTYSGWTWIQDDGVISISSIKDVNGGASSIGNPSNAANGIIYLGDGTTSGTLIYTGGAQSTDRSVDLYGTTGGGTLENNGSGTLTFTNSGFTASIDGNKTLTLQGSNDGVIQSVIPDPATTAVSVTKAGAGTWTLSGANTYTGTTTISTGTLSIGSGGTTGSISNSSNITNNSALVINRSNNYTYSGVISGTGTLTKQGAGTLTLGVDETPLTNTFSGGITISAGKINTSRSNHDILGTGTVTIASGAELELDKVNIPNNIVIDGGKILFRNGFNSSITGTISNTSTWTAEATCNCAAVMSGIISGSGGITFNETSNCGGESFTLSAANTFSGAISITEVPLIAGNTSAFGSNAAVTLANDTDAELDITGYNVSIGSITGGGGTGGNVTLGAATLTIGGDNTSPAAYAGVISGTGGITKTGTGTLILSGTNTYTGATTVSNGTLNVTGSTASGSAVTVQSGGTLAGDGTVNGSVTVNNGGVIAPGDGDESTLNTGAMTLNSTSVINMSLGTTSDQIAVTGNLTLDGVINVTNVAGFTTTTYTIMTYTGTLSDMTLKLGTMPAGYEGFISASGGNVTLTVEDYATWTYNRNITLNTTPSGADITGTINDFPVLIRLDPGNFTFSEAFGTDGQTIRFASSGGAPLPYEIEQWDDGNSAAIWVLVPTINGNDFSQYITMYWHGSTKTSASNGKAVFETDNSFQGVWHLGEDVTDEQTSGTHLDATSNANDGTQNNNVEVTGIIGTGQNLDGTADYITIVPAADDLTSATSLTMSVWFKTISTSADYFIAAGVDNSNSDRFRFGINGGQLRSHVMGNNDDGSVDITDGGWHHAVFTLDASNNRSVYLNGELQSGHDNTTALTYSDIGDVVIGQEWDPGPVSSNHFDGDLDEARISTVNRSADWVKLSYMNQRPNDKLVEIEDYSTWTGSKTMRLNTTPSGADVATAQYNFPVLIRITDDVEMDMNAAYSGNSIRFANANGSHLSYEIEEWGASSAAIWVVVDTILGNNFNQAITMYWGNSNAVTRSDGSGVFETENGFEGVWHMNQDNGDATDATSNNFDGTGNLNVDSTWDGNIGIAQQFTATDDYIEVTSFPQASRSALTVSVWASLDDESTGILVGKTEGGSPASTAGFALMRLDPAETEFSLYDADSKEVNSSNRVLPEDNSWHYITGTFGGTETKIYQNGDSLNVNTTNGSITSTANPLRFGLNDASGWDFDGILDEVRVENVTRSTDWVKLCYMNQRASGKLVEFEDYTNWSYSKSITINTSTRGANISNAQYEFPMLVRLIDDVSLDFANANSGNSLRFANGNGSHLSYEIERWCTACTPDSAEVWVNVDTVLSGDSTQAITMYWGHASAPDRSDGAGVFEVDNSFAAVFHLEEDGNTTADGYKDATTYANHGTGVNLTGTSDIMSVAGNGQDFIDGTQEITGPTSTSLEIVGNVTLNAWIYRDNSAANHTMLDYANSGETEADNHLYEFWIGSDDLLNLSWEYSTGTNEVTTSSVAVSTGNSGWVHFSVTRDVGSNEVKFYEDGVQLGTTVSFTNDPTGGSAGNLRITNNEGGGDDFIGTVDELNIAGTVRSDDWIKLTYETQKSVSWVADAEDYSLWENTGTITMNTSASGANVSEAVTDFPLLVRLTTANFNFAEAESGGEDIRFANATGTHLPYQIERWDAAADSAEIWVNVDNIAGNDATQFINMYWGNASAPDRSDGATTFDTENDFAGIWHLSETTGGTNAIKNSVSNNNHGTEAGNPAFEALGAVGNAMDFDGTGDWIDLGTGCMVNGAWTLSFWFNAQNPSDNDRLFIQGSGACASGNRQIMVFWDKTALHARRVTDGSAGNPQAATEVLSGNTWYHFSWTSDGATDSLFINGEYSSGTPDPGNMGIAGNLYIGNRDAGSNDWGGLMDEVQLAGAQRSSAWIKLAYENQKPDDALTNVYSLSSFAAAVRLEFNTTSLGLTGDVDDIPMLIRLDNDDINFGLTKPDGSDIQFVDSSGAYLYHEVIDWQTDTGSVWVKVPRVDNVDGDYITMYYGCAACPSPYAISDSVWSGYEGVWHLKGGETEALDVTGNSNTGTYSASLAWNTGVTTPIAPSYDGTNDYIDIGDVVVDGLAQLSMQGWINPASLPTDGSPDGHSSNESHVFHKAGTSDDNFGLTLATGGTSFYLDQGSDNSLTGTVLSTDTWTHVAATYDGSNMRIYINGSQDAISGSVTGSLISNTNSLRMAGRTDISATYLDGLLNEIRIANTARSADYIKLSYENQKVGSSLIDASPLCGPVAVPGLNMWLAPDSGVYEAAGNDAEDQDLVENWSDISGCGDDLWVSEATNKPKWVENAINGNPALLFDGVNDELDSLSTISLAAQEIFAVVKLETGANAFASIISEGDNDDESIRRDDTNEYYRGNSNSDANCFVNDGTVGSNWINKESTDNFTYDVPHLVNVRRNSQTTYTELSIGDSHTAARFWKGYIAEVLVYGTTLSDVDRNQVEQYLMRKYGLLPPDNVTTLTASTISSGVRLTWTDPVSTYGNVDTVGIWASTTAYPDSSRNGLLVGKFDVNDPPTIDWPQEFSGKWYFTFLTRDSLGKWSNTAAAARDTATIDGGDQKITYKFDPSAYISGAESNIPLLIRLDGSDDGIFDACPSADGTHLRFYDHDGGAGEDTLAYEIEEWTSGTSAAIWVLVPSVANGRDSLTMVYNGCTNSDASDATAVFATADNFQGVWHLAEGSGSLEDATSNNNDGTSAGSPTYGYASVIGDGMDFDGIDDEVDMGSPAVLKITAAITVSAWVNQDVSLDYSPFIDFNRTDYKGYWPMFNGTDFLTEIKRGGGAGHMGHVVSGGGTATWQYYSMTYDGNYLITYVDGVPQDTTTETETIAGGQTSNFKLGSVWTTYDRFNGKMDEVRVSDAARSEDWIRISYENQKAGTDFFDNTTYEQLIYVDDANGNDANSCGAAENPSTAKKTVESAITCTIANFADTMKVVVAPGTYSTDDNLKGNNTQHTMIMAQDPDNPPLFNGSFSSATIWIDSKKHLRNLAVTPSANNDNGVHVEVSMSQISIIGCRIYSDAYTTDLGIFTNDATQVLIANNIIHGATNEGIRVKATGSINMNIMHNVIYGPSNEGIWFETAGDITNTGIINNIFYNLTDGIEEQDATDNDVGLISHNLFHNVTNQVVGGASSDNAITGDPLFVSTDFNSPNYMKLAPGSPAIDAGTVDLTGAWTTTEDFDYLGTPRPIDDSLDIGAYEGPGFGGDVLTSELDSLTVSSTATTVTVENGNWKIVFDEALGGGIKFFYDNAAPSTNLLTGSTPLFDVSVESDYISTEASELTILSKNRVRAQVQQFVDYAARDYNVKVIYNIYASGHIYIQSEITNTGANQTADPVIFKLEMDAADSEVEQFNNNGSGETVSGYGYLLDNSSRDVLLAATQDLDILGDVLGDLKFTGATATDAITFSSSAGNHLDLNAAQIARHYFVMYIGDKSLSADKASSINADAYNPDPVSVTAGTLTGESSWQDFLAGQWSMDEGSGTSLFDLSYLGRNGTVASGVDWVSGKRGGGLKFDTDDEKVTITDNPGFEAQTQMTYMLWVNIPSGWAGSGGNANLMSKFNGANDGWQLKKNNANDHVLFRIGTDVAMEDTDDPPYDQWVHIAGVIRGTTGYLYVNGVLKSVNTGLNLVANAADVEIGDNGETGRRFVGQVDDARIYNMDAHEEFIQAIYNQGFSEKSGNYKLRANNNNRVVITMNTASAATRFQPSFEVDNWYGDAIPRYVYVNGVQMTPFVDFISVTEPKIVANVNMGNKLEIQFNKTFVDKDVDIFIDNDDSTGFMGASALMPTLTVSTTVNDKIEIQNFEGSIFGEADSKEWHIEFDLDGWDNPAQEVVTEKGFGNINLWNAAAINPGVAVTSATQLAGVEDNSGRSLLTMYLDQSATTSDKRLMAGGTGYDAPVEIGISSWLDSSSTRVKFQLATMTLTGDFTATLEKTWTVYPTGRIFGSFKIVTSTGGFDDPAVVVHARQDALFSKAWLDSYTQSELRWGMMAGGDDFHSWVAAITSVKNNTSTYTTTGSLFSSQQWSEGTSNGQDFDRGQIKMLSSLADDGDEPVYFNFMLDISTDFADSATADSLSADVRSPGTITKNGPGTEVTSDPLDFNADGFAEGEGAYTYDAESNIAQFNFALSGGVPQFYPAFKIGNWTSGGPPAIVIVNNQEQIRGYTYNASVSGDNLIIQFNQVWTGDKEVYIALKSALAVTMNDSDFVAISAVGVDSLKWTTHSEINNLGFRIKRRIKPGQDGIAPADTLYKFLFKKMIPGAPGGRSSSDRHYVYVDKTAVFGTVYEYILVAYDTHNFTQEFGPKEASPLTPLVTKLYGNYPNPFNPTTTIRFDLATQSKLALNIYNIKGQLVRRLITPDKHMKPGQYRYTWDAKNDNGVDVSTGHYILFFVTKDGYKKARKMTLLK